jgi:type IV secretory pathway TraG/TraD family ATPase VirD4
VPYFRPNSADALAAAITATRSNGGGCFLGFAGGPVFSPPDHAVLVLGPPRSGKTSSIVVPTVLGADGPVLVASTKRDVFDATATSRATVGRVTVFDPSGEEALPAGVTRIGWSPVANAGSWDRAVLCADAMVGASRGSRDRSEASHWNERAAALLAPVIHAAALGGAEMADVVRAVNRRDVSEFVSVLANRGSSGALDILVGIIETDVRELSGIFSTASSVLSAYRTDGALASAALAPIDYGDFIESADTCFILGSGEHQRHLAPLIAGMVGDVRHAAYRRSAAHGDGPRVLLVLDELANIAPLDDLPALVAEGGGQGVVTLACLQDLSQAQQRWGRAADGFLSLFGTKVVLPGIGDRRTLEGLSLLSGDGDVATVAVSGSGRVRRNWTRATRQERRVPPDAIANGPGGSAIVVTGATLRQITLAPAHATEPFVHLLPIARTTTDRPLIQVHNDENPKTPMMRLGPARRRSDGRRAPKR